MQTQTAKVIRVPHDHPATTPSSQLTDNNAHLRNEHPNEQMSNLRSGGARLAVWGGPENKKMPTALSSLPSAALSDRLR